MKLRPYLWSSLLLVSLSAASKPVLPEAFQGRWNTTCQQVDDVNFIEMSNQVFGYWEESCDVTAITAHSATDISVQLHCHTNDSTEYDSNTRYQIVNGQLITASTNAAVMRRVRCAK